MESKLLKNAATYRGISGKIVEITEQLNVAREAMRVATLEYAAVELRKVDKDIAKLETELAPLRSRRVALVAGRMDIASIEGRQRFDEATELQTAREVFEGGSITRTIETERVHYAPR